MSELRFQPVEKAVYSVDEAVTYLGLDSRRSLERLVGQQRLVPLRIGKSNLFAKLELENFVERELARERKLRNVD